MRICILIILVNAYLIGVGQDTTHFAPKNKDIILKWDMGQVFSPTIHGIHLAIEHSIGESRFQHEVGIIHRIHKQDPYKGLGYRLQTEQRFYWNNRSGKKGPAYTSVVLNFKQVYYKIGKWVCADQCKFDVWEYKTLVYSTFSIFGKIGKQIKIPNSRVTFDAYFAAGPSFLYAKYIDYSDSRFILLGEFPDEGIALYPGVDLGILIGLNFGQPKRPK